MLNERVQRMRNKLWDSRPCITAERLELQTEAYKKFAGRCNTDFSCKGCKVHHGENDNFNYG